MRAETLRDRDRAIEMVEEGEGREEAEGEVLGPELGAQRRKLVGRRGRQLGVTVGVGVGPSFGLCPILADAPLQPQQVWLRRTETRKPHKG